MRILLKVKIINDETLEILRNIGLVVEDVFLNLNIIVLNAASDKLIDELECLDFVEILELDEIYELEKNDIRVLPDLKYQTLHRYDYYGSNIRVAMIDSGVDIEGISLEGNITFTNIEPYDSGCNGRNHHGTYVAHIIKKVAPWCKLYALKVVNSDGEIWKRAILKAIDWCITNKISVINMSLGRKETCKENCLVCSSLKLVRENKGVAIVAVGNYGREGEGIIGCPATSQYAFTVGAINEFRQIAEYSSRGDSDTNKPDILAPGWIQLTGHNPITGTSFSAPFITGIIACLINEFDVEYIIKVMCETATDLGIPKNWQGSGLVDIKKMMGVLKHEESINTSN